MALATQTKILRVLQAGEIQRVGGTETIKVDVRVIGATNKDLEEMVKAKTFREDLYYRLNVVRIKMPPLRERGDDIPQIVDFCLQNLVKNKKARVSKVSPEAMAALTRHTWPGNVRELENVIYRSAVIAQGDAILVKDLPAELRAAGADEIETSATAETLATDEVQPAEASAAPVQVGIPPASPAIVEELAAPVLTLERAIDFAFDTLRAEGKPLLPRMESEFIARAMKTEGGDVTKAAKILGITKAAVQKRAGGS